MDGRFLTPPSTIAPTLWRLVRDGQIEPHLYATMERILVGFALSVAAGVVLGLLCAMWRPADWTVSPIVELIRAVPTLALLPAFMLLFGIGFRFPVAVVVWVAWVPVFLTTIQGVRAVPREIRDAALVDGANRLELLRDILFPLASPSILSGMRLALGNGFVVIVVAEMLGATKGLGFYIFEAQQTFHISEMYATIVLMGAVAFAANAALVALMYALVPASRGV